MKNINKNNLSNDTMLRQKISKFKPKLVEPEEVGDVCAYHVLCDSAMLDTGIELYNNYYLKGNDRFNRNAYIRMMNDNINLTITAISHAIINRIGYQLSTLINNVINYNPSIWNESTIHDMVSTIFSNASKYNYSYMGIAGVNIYSEIRMLCMDLNLFNEKIKPDEFDFAAAINYSNMITIIDKIIINIDNIIHTAIYKNYIYINQKIQDCNIDSFLPKNYDNILVNTRNNLFDIFFEELDNLSKLQMDIRIGILSDAQKQTYIDDYEDPYFHYCTDTDTD